ncbi:hypothetical protein, partial [Enterobacter hormaechei]
SVAAITQGAASSVPNKINVRIFLFPIGKSGNILTRNSTVATEKVDLLTSKAGRPKIGYF